MNVWSRIAGWYRMLCLTCRGLALLFPTVTALFYIPTSTYEGSNSSTSSRALVIVSLFSYSHLVNVRWYFFALFCIFLKANDVESFS